MKRLILVLIVGLVVVWGCNQREPTAPEVQTTKPEVKPEPEAKSKPEAKPESEVKTEPEPNLQPETLYRKFVIINNKPAQLWTSPRNGKKGGKIPAGEKVEILGKKELENNKINQTWYQVANIPRFLIKISGSGWIKHDTTTGKVIKEPINTIHWGQIGDGLRAGILCNTQKYVFDGKERDAVSVIACYVRNITEKPIVLPAVFGSFRMTLFGQGATHRWPCRLWFRYRSSHQKYIVEPHGEVKIFEEKISSLLNPDRKEWGWIWEAHPSPPKSPAHKGYKQGYESSVTFWFAVYIGDSKKYDAKKTAISPKVTLEILAGEKTR